MKPIHNERYFGFDKYCFDKFPFEKFPFDKPLRRMNI